MNVYLELRSKAVKLPSYLYHIAVHHLTFFQKPANNANALVLGVKHVPMSSHWTVSHIAMGATVFAFSSGTTSVCGFLNHLPDCHSVTKLSPALNSMAPKSPRTDKTTSSTSFAQSKGSDALRYAAARGVVKCYPSSLFETRVRGWDLQLIASLPLYRWPHLFI